MIETVYNLIGYFDEKEIISFLGIATHDVDGSDDEKLQFLSSRAHSDSQIATRFLLPDRYKLKTRDGEFLPGNHTTLATFRQLIRENKADIVFEEAMTVMGASTRPLVCVTPIHEPTDVSLQAFEAFMHPSQYRGS